MHNTESVPFGIGFATWWTNWSRAVSKFQTILGTTFFPGTDKMTENQRIPGMLHKLLTVGYCMSSLYQVPPLIFFGFQYSHKRMETFSMTCINDICSESLGSVRLFGLAMTIECLLEFVMLCFIYYWVNISTFVGSISVNPVF